MASRIHEGELRLGCSPAVRRRFTVLSAISAPRRKVVRPAWSVPRRRRRGGGLAFSIEHSGTALWRGTHGRTRTYCTSVRYSNRNFLVYYFDTVLNSTEI